MRGRSLTPKALRMRGLHAKPITTYTLQSYKQRQRYQQRRQQKEETEEVEEVEETESD